jgi:Fe-S oxidoreductase
MHACPVNGLGWEGFDGPTTLVQIARRLFDCRDNDLRLPDAVSAGVEHCVACYSCVNACPVEIGILQGAIENFRKKIVEQGKCHYAKYNDTWKHLVVTNGVVNPFILMRRSSTVSALLRNALKGIKFFLKGKVSFGSKRLSNIEEVRSIHEKIGAVK